MRETEEFRLPQSRTSARGERDASPDVEQRTVDAEQTDSRQMASKSTKLRVLIGAGTLQLPIWGTFGQMSELQRYLRKCRLCNELWCIPGILLQ
jgi:hypothetical protein